MQRSGSITPLGSAVEPLVNCRIVRRSGSSLTGVNPRGVCTGVALELVEGEHVGAAGRLEERCELGVDEHERHVGVRDACARLRHELLDRPEPHRERQRHDRAAREPDAPAAR